MEDGGHCTLSPTERLEILNRQEQAWDNARWSSEFELHMEDGGVWEIYGGVLAQGTSPHSLTFTQLPSEIRNIPKKTWTVEKLPFNMRDFTMDPSQDLLVIVERQLR